MQGGKEDAVGEGRGRRKGRGGVGAGDVEEKGGERGGLERGGEGGSGRKRVREESLPSSPKWQLVGGNSPAYWVG